MIKRIIALVDLDYFYAQVEQLRDPKLKGKPVVVCMYSARGGDSGAVATASYEARALGIHAGMPIIFAKRKTEAAEKEGKIKKGEAVFLPADREYYSKVSDRIMDIIREHAPVLEQVSIDEAYFDLGFCENFEEAEKVAKKIKADIKLKENLTCSIGIGPNKLIAKMSASVNKPDGLTAITEGKVLDFISPMKVSKLHGVGDKTEKILNDLGIVTIGDLWKFSDEKKNYSKLEDIFGKKRAELLKEHSQGIDDSPLDPEAEQLQYSRMGTLKKDTNKLDEIEYLVEELTEELVKNIKKENVRFKTISIIPITNEIKTHTKSKTLEEFTDSEKLILDTAKDLLKEFLKYNPELILRRFGVRVSNLEKMQDDKQTEKKNQKNLSAFRK